MNVTAATEVSASSVFIEDGDVVTRHAVANYLRHCGYSLVQSATTDEAFVALNEPNLSIDVVLCDISAVGSRTCFELANWVRANRPELGVKLTAGIDTAAQTAAELCETALYFARPYEPQTVVDCINQLRGSR